MGISSYPDHNTDQNCLNKASTNTLEFYILKSLLITFFQIFSLKLEPRQSKYSSFDVYTSWIIISDITFILLSLLIMVSSINWNWVNIRLKIIIIKS